MALRRALSARQRTLRVIVVVGVAVGLYAFASPALAATCTGSTVTVTPFHSPDGTTRPFYGDWSHGSTKHSGYVGYQLTGANGVLGNDVWVKLSGFAGGSVGLAANQSASIPSRSVSSTGKPVVYAYLTASASTAAAQSWTVEVWNGKPGQSGSTQVCTTTDGFSSVIDVISANANKITAITVSNATPPLGGNFSVTAVGDTGTMGAGVSSDQSGGNGVFSMAPSMDDSWPADAFQLTGVQVSIGGTTTRDKLRIYPGTSAAGAYTAVYSFSVRKAPGSSTAVYPVQNIASGTQVKYTGSYPAGITSIGVPTITASLVKTAQSLIGPPYAVSYQVVASNTSTSAVTLDYLKDTPTASSWSFATGSATLNGQPIADPVNASGTLVFSGPFTIPAASGATPGTLVFGYTLNVTGTVTNNAVGEVGGVLIGGSNGGNQTTIDPSRPNISGSLADGTVGTAYSQTLIAVGGTSPYAWAITSGSLPAGLILNPVTGVISGTPTTVGSSTFTVSVLDFLAAAATRTYTVSIAAAPLADTTAPDGAVLFDGSPATITSPAATLDLTATDAVGVTAYRFAEGSDCSAASWISVSSTTSFSTTTAIVLSASDGTKTVCAEFKDAAGNVSTTALTTVLLDLPPTLALSSSAADPVNGAFSVTATFGKSVTGFALGDIVVGNGSASNLSGSGTTYTFDVTPAVDGTVTVDVGADTAADAAGTGNSAATQLVRTYDGTAPTVTLTSAAPNPTNAPFSVTATFSETVTGFTLGDLQLTNGAASNLSGSGTTYTFDITPTADGTVSVRVAAAAAVDGAGNASVLSAALTRTYDGTAPTVILGSASSSPLNGAFTVTATFSEPVTGFSLGGISVSNGSASNLSGSGAVYTFAVTPASEGTVSVSVGVAAATDAAGNTSAASNTLSRTYDATVPTVTLTSAAPATTNTAPISVTATFSEAVTGLGLVGIQVGNGTASNLSGSGTTYTFDVTPTTQGTVTVQVAAAAAADLAGNANLASNQLSRSYDSAAPTVTLTSASPSPTNAAFSITATFSEIVTGFALGDLQLANGAASNLAGSGTTYTFDVTPATDGVVSVQVTAGAAVDGAGNSSTVSNTLTRIYDGIVPTVTLSSASASPLNGPFSVTATFSEAVTGLALGGVSVTNGTASNLAGSGTTYTFDVTPAADGIVSVQVTAGAASDGAGNSSTASAPLSRTYDATPPAVTLTSAAPASANSTPIPVTVTFSEAVSGLSLGDIGVTNGTASNLGGSGATYTFDVTPVAQGTVTVQIAAAAAVDLAGNASLASNQLTRTYDTVPPAVTLTAAVPSPTDATTFTVTATFSAPVSGLTLGDIHVTNGTASNLAGSGTTYTFDIAPAHDGPVLIEIGAGAATDSASNPSTAATPLDLTFASDPPAVSVDDSPDRRTLDPSALFAFSSDQTVTHTCSLDGAGFAPCTSPLDLSGLSGGDHTLVIRATNAYGASSTSTIIWTVLVPPAVTFDLTPPDGSEPDVAFTWDADPTATVECSLDAGAYGPCAAPEILRDLPDGAHTFTVRASGGDGAQTVRTYTWTVARHPGKPPARVVIIPKVTAKDMLGRPKPFRQTRDRARSKGPFTRKLDVKLHIPTPTSVGSDVVFVSNYPDFRDSRVFPIARDELYDWTLLAGPSGDRPVYIRFSDDADAAVGTANIVLDQELPTLRPVFVRIGIVPTAHPGVAAAAGSCGHAPRRWITIGGRDRFSGLNAVQVASDPRHPCAWRPFLPTFSYRLPGRVVYIRVEDHVGNISRWYRLRTPR